ncbi:DUF2442 domain-containing protein [Clostridium perfringens]|uniref:DUF2442 domain-containing protein n=1 Tax=Clostridium perfringens TaxID=1502 RepID=UPI0011570FB0|nr:DUF2442 domain-containing protein [Clostridium perfringens]ELC8349200.1 DUF2442 domain-containing protein [Clostridium perfringens]MBI6089081.1 DUF2442 domain-containing protein [Clostridium perfringens]MBI6094529.1 DUF2442 domain-containing protein [Clostridium perfringens]MDK0530737.1 DUF2442 domain-containing protein [Clostridium perfringens]MDK0557493.1 DUF2442 domain-containing protein [Clostridium perfringens]
MINNISIYKNYILKIEMNNNEVKYFNVEPYLEFGDFKILKDKNKFKDFEVDELEGINWLNGVLCLSKDTLLKNSYYDD